MPVAGCDTMVWLLGWHVGGGGLVIVLVLAPPALVCGFRCSGWGLRVTSVESFHFGGGNGNWAIILRGLDSFLISPNFQSRKLFGSSYISCL